MGKILAITGVTGPKSGSSFLNLIVQNITLINSLYPGGVNLLVRNPDKLDDLIKKNNQFKICVGDLENENYLIEELKGVDTLVHIAGIQYSKTIFTTATKCKVRRIITIHTTGIYSKYKKVGEEYRQIDEFCLKLSEKHNIGLTILRPTMIYGNEYDQNVIVFIKMVDKFPIMPIVSDARFKLSPVHYEDLAKAYFAVLINEKKTVNRDFVLSGGMKLN